MQRPARGHHQLLLLLLLVVLLISAASAFVVTKTSLRPPVQRRQTHHSIITMGNIFSSVPSLDSFLQDKVIWITGASSGLGRSLSIECARHGARLILTARDKAKLEAVKEECLAVMPPSSSSTPSSTTPKVLIAPLDMSKFQEDDSPSFTTTAAAVAQTMGTNTIDILINNAGVSTRSSATDTTLDVDISVMATNFFGPVALTKATLPYLRKSTKGAHLIVINSVQGKLGLGMRTSYSASKHALTGYFDSLRAELSAENIPVTAIFPGYIKTNLSLNALTGQGELYGKMDETTSKGLDPTELAVQILKAAAKGEAEVVVCPLDAKVAIFLRNWVPNLVFKILGKKARKALAPEGGVRVEDDKKLA